MTGSISDRQIEALNAIAEGLQAIAAAVRETGRTEDVRIGRCVAAERPGAGSAGRGASGGVSGVCNGEGDHSWRDITTQGDSWRKVTVEVCIHCGATKEERA